MTTIISMDWRILYAIYNNWHTTWGDSVMIWCTQMGNNGLIWILIAMAMLFSNKWRRYAPFLLAAIAAAAFIGEGVIKPLVCRVRPCYIVQTQMLIERPSGYSFPSGHSMSSFAAAFFIEGVNHAVGIICLILAVGIAFSRVYLFVHFPSDVLSGALLGSFVGIATYKVYQAMSNEPIKRQ